MKWDVGQVTIRNVHAHDNDYRGLWADMNARGALIEHNLVEDNWAEGIFYEISQDAVIRNNRIYRNGVRAESWYWDGGITVASSFNVEVYSNRLSGNHNGITGTQQNRLDSTPPAHLLDNYHVHDNLICATAGQPPHRRGGRQRRQPWRPRHQLHPQHHPVVPVRVVDRPHPRRRIDERTADRPRLPDRTSGCTNSHSKRGRGYRAQEPCRAIL